MGTNRVFDSCSMHCRSNDYLFVNMKIKTEDTLERGRVYEFIHDGKDFVLLQAKNRNERRSYKYKAKQLKNEVKPCHQQKSSTH